MTHSDRNNSQKESFENLDWKDDEIINNLIQKLNKASGRHDYIRRHKCLPRIYAITIDACDDWKLCKIGLTRTESNSRQKSIKSKLDNDYGETNVRELFVLDISGTDHRCDEEIEEYVRRSCGYSVNKKLANKLGLNWKTEWVFTNKAFIKRIKNEIKSSEYANTKIFRTVNFENFDTETTRDLPPFLENLKKQKCKIELRENEIICSNDDDSSEKDDQKNSQLLEVSSDDDAMSETDLPKLASPWRSSSSTCGKNEVPFVSNSPVQSIITDASKPMSGNSNTDASSEKGLPVKRTLQFSSSSISTRNNVPSISNYPVQSTTTNALKVLDVGSDDEAMSETNLSCVENELPSVTESKAQANITDASKNELFPLVTDQGFLTVRNVVWETLSNIESDGYFVDAHFHTYRKPPPPAKPDAPIGAVSGKEQVDQDYLLAMSSQHEQQMRDDELWSQNQQPQQRTQLSDHEIAARLQAEEDEHAALAAQQQQQNSQPHPPQHQRPAQGGATGEHGTPSRRPRERESGGRNRDKSREKEKDNLLEVSSDDDAMSETNLPELTSPWRSSSSTCSENEVPSVSDSPAQSIITDASKPMSGNSNADASSEKGLPVKRTLQFSSSSISTRNDVPSISNYPVQSTTTNASKVLEVGSDEEAMSETDLPCGENELPSVSESKAQATITDVSKRNEVWETLSNVEGDGYFVDAHFHTYRKPPPPAEPVAPIGAVSGEEQVDQDHEIAARLQAEEAERAALAVQQQYQQQQNSQPHPPQHQRPAQGGATVGHGTPRHRPREREDGGRNIDKSREKEKDNPVSVNSYATGNGEKGLPEKQTLQPSSSSICTGNDVPSVSNYPEQSTTKNALKPVSVNSYADVSSEKGSPVKRTLQSSSSISARNDVPFVSNCPVQSTTRNALKPVSVNSYADVSSEKGSPVKCTLQPSLSISARNDVPSVSNCPGQSTTTNASKPLSVNSYAAGNSKKGLPAKRTLQPSSSSISARNDVPSVFNYPVQSTSTNDSKDVLVISDDDDDDDANSQVDTSVLITPLRSSSSTCSRNDVLRVSDSPVHSNITIALKEEPNTGYQCQVCDNISFSNVYQISDHVKRKHGGSKWLCRRCRSPIVTDGNSCICNSKSKDAGSKTILQSCIPIWKKVGIRAAKRAAENEDGDDYCCRKKIKPAALREAKQDEDGDNDSVR